jgi:hypothetical protein
VDVTPLEQSILWMLRGGTWRIGRLDQPDTLCSHLHASRRDVEAAVESLRLAGHPIIGGADGLRLTEDPDELEKYVEARRRRMASIYLGSRALRKTLRRLRERSDLTLWGAA